MLSNYISTGYIYFSDGHAEEILSVLSIGSENVYFTTMSGRYLYSERYQVEWTDDLRTHAYPHFNRTESFEKYNFEEEMWEEIDNIDMIVLNEKLKNGKEKEHVYDFRQRRTS